MEVCYDVAVVGVVDVVEVCSPYCVFDLVVVVAGIVVAAAGEIVVVVETVVVVVVYEAETGFVVGIVD